MWQNVSKISPLFCGKIFEIFCHGLPAGGGQLFRTSTIFLPLLTPTFRQTPVNDSRHCVKFYCSARVTALCFAPGIRLGLLLINRVLPTAIPACVPWRLVLLPLRHVHLVHQVHQVHLAKCFVTKTCASAFDRAPGIRLGLFAGAYRQPLHRRLVRRARRRYPGLPRFARGGTTIARHCDFLSPLDPFLGSLA